MKQRVFTLQNGRYQIACAHNFFRLKNNIKEIKRQIFEVHKIESITTGFEKINLSYKIKKCIRNLHQTVFQGKVQVFEITGESGRCNTALYKAKIDGKLYFIKAYKREILKDKDSRSITTKEFVGLYELEKNLLGSNAIKIHIIKPIFAITDHETGYAFICYPYIKNFLSLKQASDRKKIPQKEFKEYEKKLIELNYKYKVKIKNKGDFREEHITDINTENTHYDLKTKDIYIFDVY